MATQRIWRDGVEADPPADWTFVYIPFARIDDCDLWFTEMHVYIRDECAGEWAMRIRMETSTYSDRNGILFGFSDRLAAMAVKTRWG